jgi:myosin-6
MRRFSKQLIICICAEEAEARYAALQQQMEQERRDHELALRLAAESRGGVVDDVLVKRTDSITSTTKLENGLNQLQLTAGARKKFDLSKWKYAELRDTINTSCDIELLEACREEFHRRLKVYHAWKAKNKKKNATFDENVRAPNIVMEEAAARSGRQPRNNAAAARKPVLAPSQHRYFRIPFVRPDQAAAGGGEGDTTGAALRHIDPAKQNERGWWYAHFDGEWIGRQMELHEGMLHLPLHSKPLIQSF